LAVVWTVSGNPIGAMHATSSRPGHFDAVDELRMAGLGEMTALAGDAVARRADLEREHGDEGRHDPGWHPRPRHP